MIFSFLSIFWLMLSIYVKFRDIDIILKILKYDYLVIKHWNFTNCSLIKAFVSKNVKLLSSAKGISFREAYWSNGKFYPWYQAKEATNMMLRDWSLYEYCSTRFYSNFQFMKNLKLNIWTSSNMEHSSWGQRYCKQGRERVFEWNRVEKTNSYNCIA